MRLTVEQMLNVAMKSKNLQEYIENLVVRLSEDNELYSFMIDAKSALTLVRNMNDRNKKWISDKTRFDIERILVPFIIEAEEKLNEPEPAWVPPEYS